MNILMFLRDPLPCWRVDVSVLFDVELRRLGYATDFVGVQRDGGSRTPTNGRMFVCRAAATARLTDVVRAFVHDVAVAVRLGGRYDVVIVRDRPIEAAVLFAIARLRRIPTAYWMSFPIPLADRLNARAHWRRGARLRAALVWWRGYVGSVIERFVSLSLADKIFVQSDTMKLELTLSGIRDEKMSAVPMGVDLTLLQQIAPSSDRLDHCVVYVGTLNQERRLDFLIDAFVLIRTQVPSATLLVIGDGDHPEERAQLERQVAAHGMQAYVRFTGRLPLPDALALAARCAIGVSLIPRGPLFESLSPTKVVEYLALGLPVVGNAIPDQRMVIEASGGGICVPYDLQSFAAAVVELLNDPVRRADCGKAGREYVMAHRNYRRLAQLVADDLAPLDRSRSSALPRTTIS